MRSWKNWAIGVLGLVVVALGVALVANQSGASRTQAAKATPDGSQSSEEQALARGANATATSTPEATPTPEPDADNDGVADDVDYAPHNRKIQTKTDAHNCNVLGINFHKLREGACTDDNGAKLKVVNRATTLVLPEMSVRLLSVEPTTEIPRPYDSPLVGHFVVAHLAVTNRLNSPVEIDASNMFALLLGKRTYDPNSDAMIDSADDGLIMEDVQPDETATGIVVFNVASKRWAALEKNGNLFAAQFSDADVSSSGASPRRRVGIIRTYN